MERIPAVEQVNIDGGKFIREAKVRITNFSIGYYSALIATNLFKSTYDLFSRI